MAARGKVKFLPLGSILDRYLAQGFLRVFVISLICITSLYLVVDFFDRISTFVDSGASLGTIIRYFFYKAPASISRVIGFATLFSTLFCLGMLARTQEITAMRSSGISVQRIAFPLLDSGSCSSVCSLFLERDAGTDIRASSANHLQDGSQKQTTAKSVRHRGHLDPRRR